MSSINVVQDMAPPAKAIAEVRAREAGMSLAEWLEAIVYQKAARAPTPWPAVDSGGALWPDAIGGSTPPSGPVRPTERGDTDIVTYLPRQPWTPSGRAERLWNDAFVALCDLTPVRHELLVLFQHDPRRACAELAKYLELANQQFELSANLLTEVEAPSPAQASDEQRFKQLRLSLLERAGGGMSLTQGAQLLGVTRQALHKRVKSGAALGMMDGGALVLPRLQFVTEGDTIKIIKGLGHVVSLFERAGGWSALQFLVETDPNLGGAPIEALKAGKVDAVVAAARAYLGFDEG